MTPAAITIAVLALSWTAYIVQRISERHQRSTSTPTCTLCDGLGWILDRSGPNRTPISLELLPCLIPDCTASGRPIATLAIAHGGPWHPIPHPATGHGMAVEPDDA